MQAFSSVSEKDILNEIRAIDKVCKEPHDNIVRVLEHGRLPNSRYYYVDMVLCSLNLAQYLNGDYNAEIASTLACSIKAIDRQTNRKMRTVWYIMEQVTTGLQYIHSLDITHRDLKPQNGAFSGGAC